jgi:hypothetical protein
MTDKNKMTTSDLSNQTALVLDWGYFPELAKSLGGKDGYGTTIYGTAWHNYNPTPDKAYMGKDVPGLIWVEEYEDYIDSSDIFVMFDVGAYSTQRRLRRQGKKVFGAGESEIIEMDRLRFKEILAEAGLAQPPYIPLYGIEELRKHLKANDDLWIKIDSKWRGIKETWYHEDWLTSETTIDELAHTLGFIRNQFRFIAEECWPGIETGCDFFVSSGKYLPIGTYGFEEKNEGYICKAVPLDQMPKAVKKINDGMAPFYERWNTCGMASTEARILSEALHGYKVGESYFLDATQRAGSPPAEIISALYTNFPHIVRACANGEMITPAPRAKYAAQVILKSGMAMCESTPVSVEKGFEDRIKFRRQCVVGGQTFIIPMHGDEIIGAAVGWGDTQEQAQDMALEAADNVKCKELYFNANVFEDITETIEQGKELGLGDF